MSSNTLVVRADSPQVVPLSRRATLPVRQRLQAISLVAMGCLLLSFVAPSAAQAQALRSFSLTPERGEPRSRVVMQIHFSRPGKAFPIVTSDNPRVFNPGSVFRTDGAPSITRTLRRGTRTGCANVTVSWNNRTLRDRVCVRLPPATVQITRMCNSFDLRGPADSTTLYSRTVNFSWNSCLNAGRYDLMVGPRGSGSYTTLWSGNATSQRVTVPLAMGADVDWRVVARRGNQISPSNSSRLIRFACRLTWNDPLTECNLSDSPDQLGWAGWPDEIRRRVEGRFSIQDIVSSRVVVRGDDNECSTCHHRGQGFRYQPDIEQNATTTLTSTTPIARCGNSNNANLTWQNCFAIQFTNNVGGTTPPSGVKPDYLIRLIQKWIADGSQP